MSDYTGYDDAPRRYQSTRTRPRRRDDNDYVEETTFIERGKGPPPRDLVYRGHDDSVEDIPRDFPPPGRSRGGGRSDYYDDYEDPGPRRARSVAGRSRYDDDDYDDYGPAAAGAVAGYGAGRRRDNRRQGSYRDGYYSDDYSPPRRGYDDRRGDDRREDDKRKSGLEQTLEGLGLGGVVGGLLGKAKSRAGSRERDSRGRYHDDDRSRRRSTSRGKGERRERQWAQAAQAAIVAGAVEAIRSRKEPGPWTGDKGKRVATAALGAGGIDKLIGRNPDEKTKRHLVEAVLGGLAANRLANGPREGPDSRGRSRSRSRSGIRGRSRSIIDRFRSKSRGRSTSAGSEDGDRRARSKSRGGLEKLAAGGAIAAAGKALYDRMRSKSRKRRSPSRGSSADSYATRRRGGRDVGSSRSIPPNARNPDDGAVVGPRGRGIGAGAGAMALAHHGGDGTKESERKRDSSTDSLSSTDMENQRRRMRGKEYLTAALASIATIHAAHGVYQSMEASEKRHKLVAEGEMSKEEARKKRSKAWLQDAAAVGIAALGIKGAFSEWKEMNHQRQSVRELEQRRRDRQKRRAQRFKEAREAGLLSSGRGGWMDDGSRRPTIAAAPPGYGGYANPGAGMPGYADGGGGGGFPPPPMGAAGGGAAGGDGRY